MSLDGYIASEAGTYDWIVGDGDKALNTEQKFDFNEFLSGVDTVVMGRKAFDDCPVDIFKSHNIIVATTQRREDHDNVRYVSGDLVGILNKEKQLEGKDIYLFGGGVLVEPLITANVIDEYIIGLIPTILGKGRPLFMSEHEEIKLHLHTYNTEEGQVILHYTKR